MLFLQQSFRIKNSTCCFYYKMIGKKTLSFYNSNVYYNQVFWNEKFKLFSIK